MTENTGSISGRVRATDKDRESALHAFRSGKQGEMALNEFEVTKTTRMLRHTCRCVNDSSGSCRGKFVLGIGNGQHLKGVF